MRSRHFVAAITVVAVATTGLATTSAGADDQKVVSSALTVDQAADAGPGSLRVAIERANARVGADTITIDVDNVIQPESPLPAITDAATIAGNGAEVRGRGRGDGLRVEADDVVLADLVVREFETGVVIDRASRVSVVRNTITDNRGAGIAVVGPTKEEVAALLASGTLELAQLMTLVPADIVLRENSIDANGGPAVTRVQDEIVRVAELETDGKTARGTVTAGVGAVTVDVYASDECDPARPQAARLVGSVDAAADGTFTLDVAGARGELTAIATDESAGSSSISACASAVAPPAAPAETTSTTVPPTSSPTTIAPVTTTTTTTTTVATPSGRSPQMSMSGDAEGASLQALVVPACTKTWTGLAGSTSWHDALNWSPGGVPSDPDVVCIPLGASVAHSTGTTQVTGLDVAGALSISGGELRVTGPSNVATLALGGGTLSGSGDIEVGGAFQWTSGTLAGPGTLTLAAGVSADLSSTGTKSLSKPLINQTTINWTGGHLQMRSDLGAVGELDNQSVLNINIATQQSAGWCCGTTRPDFTNSGTINFQSTGPFSIDNLDVTNTGTINLGAVNLTLTGSTTTIGGTIAGTDTGDATGVLSITSGDHTFTGNIVDVLIFEVAGGAATLTPTATLTAEIARTSGGSFNLNTTEANTTIDLLGIFGGTLTATTDLAPIHTFQWTSGTLAGPGTLTLAAGVSADLSSTGTKSLSKPLINQTTINWTGGHLQMRSDLGAVGELDNQSVLNINIATQQSAGWCCGTTRPDFTNSGTINFQSTGPFSIDNLDVTNTGTINLGAVNLTLTGSTTTIGGTIAGTDTGDATGVLSITSGDHTFTGNIVDVLIFEVAGGAATLTPTATLTAEIARTSGGSFNLNTTEANTTIDLLGIFGGTLTATTDLAPIHTFQWTSGTLAGPGTLTLAAGVSADLSSTGTKSLSKPLINQTTINWTGGHLQMRSDLGAVGELDNQSVLNINIATQQSAGWCCGTTRPDFTNSGTINFQSTGPFSIDNLDVTNTGTINLGAVNLTLTGSTTTIGGTIAGTDTGDATGVLSITSGDHTFTGNIVDVLIFEVAGGAATLTPTATLTAEIARTSGGSFNLNTTEANTTIDLLGIFGGTLTATTDLAPIHTFQWTSGTLAGPGTLTLAAGVSADLSSTGTKSLSKPLINQTTINWTGGHLQMRSDLGAVGELDNQSVLNINIATQQSAGWCCGTTRPDFTNSGTINFQSTGPFSIDNLDVTNTGTINLGAVNLTLTGSTTTIGGTIAGTDTGDATGVLSITSGDHTFTGNIVDVLIFEVAGGAATLTPTATLTAEIARTSGGSFNLNTTEANTTIDLLGIFGGTLTATTDLAPIHTFQWTSGTLAGPGTLTLAAGVSVPWSTSGTKSLSKTIVNRATIAYTGGHLQMRSDLNGIGRLENRGTINVDIPSQQSAGWCCGTTQPDFFNFGTVNFLTGATYSFDNLRLVNTGTINVGTATVVFSGSNNTISGTITGTDTSALTVQSGEQTFAGQVTIGILTVNSGAAIFNSAAVADLGFARAVGGVLAFLTADANTTVGVLSVGGGTLDTTTNVAPTDSFFWTSGGLTGPGVLTLAPGLFVPWSTSGTKSLSKKIVNQTTIGWTGGHLQMRSDMGGVGHLDNQGTLNIDIASQQSAGWCCGAIRPDITNTGTITFLSDTIFTVDNIDVSNTGTIDVRSGDFRLNSPVTQLPGTTLTAGTWRVADDATLRIENGDIRTNNATIALEGATARIIDQNTANAFRNFTTNSGTIELGPDATFDVPATFTQTAAGRLVSRMNADGHGLLRAGTTATLDGTIEGAIAPGFVVPLGTSFHVVDAATLNGTFANVVGPFDASYDTSAGDAFLTTNDPLAACNVTWDGGAGDGQWSTPTNWHTDTVPDADDTACISNGAGLVTHNGGDATVGSVQVFGPDNGTGLRIEGGTFTIGTDSDIAGFLELAGGTLTVGGELLLSLDDGTDALFWNGGTMAGAGSVHLVPNALATIVGAAPKTLTTHLVNEGVLDWGDGDLRFGSGAHLDNAGTLNLTGGDLTVTELDVTNAQITNRTGATISKTGIDPTNLGTRQIRFTNNGLISADGPLGLSGNNDSTSSGNILPLNGEIDFLGGTWEVTGLIQGTSDLAILGATIRVSGDGNIALPGLAVFGGTLDLDNGPDELNVVTDFELAVDGTVDGNETLTVLDTFEWASGTIAGTVLLDLEDLNDPPTGTIHETGTKTLTGELVNEGVLDWGDGDLRFGSGAHLDNAGTLNLTGGDLTVTELDVTNAQITNRTGATISKTGIDPTNLGTRQIRFTNNGLISADGPLGLSGNNDSTSSGNILPLNGEIDFLGGTWEVTGLIQGTSDLAILGATIRVSGDGNIALPGLAVFGGTLDLDNGPDELNVVTDFELAVDGTVDGNETLTVLDTFEWASGTIAGTVLLDLEDLNDPPTGTIHETGTKTLTGLLRNEGVITWSEGDLTVGTNGELASPGDLLVTSPDTVTFAAAPGAPDFTNFGLLQIGPGRLRVTGTDFVNDSGFLDVGNTGTLDVQGSFTQSAGGEFDVAVAGPAAESENGKVLASGAATIDGTLGITTVAPFSPTSGSFTVIDASSVSGTFATVTGTAIGNGFDYLVDIDASDGDVFLNVSGVVHLTFDGDAAISEFAGDFPIDFSIDRALSESLHLVYVTEPGTATEDNDYEPVIVADTIPAGETTGSASIPLIEDAFAEPDETFTVRITSAEAGATQVVIDDEDAVATIVNDDGPIPQLGFDGDVAISEGDLDLAVDFSLDRVYPVDLDVTVATDDGTATAGADYDALATTITIPAGQLTGTATVPLHEDDFPEDDETLTVRITGVDGHGGTVDVVDDDALVTIVNDDAGVPPVVTITPASIPEAAGTFAVMVEGTGGNTAIDVFVSALDGTATAPADWAVTAQTVSVAPNSSTPVLVTVQNDTADEFDETFTMLAGSAVAQMTIVDDDDPPRAVIDGLSITEGDNGQIEAELAVRLVDPILGLVPQPSGKPVVVQGATADGTALAGEDYVGTVEAVTFTAGQTTRTFSVPIIGDATDEPNQTFTVDLEALLDVTVSDTEDATVTIIDDDGADTEVRDALEEGGQALDDALPNWGEAFNLDDFDFGELGLDPFELPVVTDDLGDLFGTAQRLGDVENPLQNLDEDLDQLLDQLEALGFEVEWVEGGIGGRPLPPTAPDILQLRYTQTLEDLAQALGFTGDGFNDEMVEGVLDGIASAFGLDATLVTSADLRLSLVLGVDESGFYVEDDTGLTLALDASATATGAGDVAGIDGLELTGTGVADIDVSLRADGGPLRLRVADLAGDPHAYMRPSATGTATLTLDAALDPLTATITSEHTLTVDAGLNTDVEHQLGFAGALTLPQLTLTLDGTFDGTTWQLHGAGDAATDYALDGFALENLEADATITPDTFAGAFDADVLVNIGGPQPAVAGVHATFNGAALHATAHVTLDDQTFGASPALVYLDGATLDVALDANFAIGASDITADLHADTMVLLPEPAAPGVVPDGAATASDVDASVDSDGNVTIHAGMLSGAIADAIEFTLTDVALFFGPDAPAHVLEVPTVTATVPDLGDLTVALTGFHLNRNGTFGVSTIFVEPGSIAEELAIAGILPFDVDEVGIEFPDRENLDEFLATVDGSFDFTAMEALPFDPIIGIGDDAVTPDSPAADNRFTFSIAVDSFAAGQIRPFDFGPITLGFEDLDIGATTVGASLTLGGYEDGEWSDDFGGSLTLDGIDAFEGDLGITVEGSLDEDAGTLDLNGVFSVSANLSENVVIEDANLAFALGIEFGDGFTITGPTLNGADIGRVFLRFGDVMRLETTGVDIDFDPAPGASLVTFDTIGVEFDEGAVLLADWGGTAGNVGISSDFEAILFPGFFLSIDPPEGENFGLPDFLPFTLDEATIKFPNIDFENLPGEGLTLDDFSDFVLDVSGGVVANETWPISATVDNLEVDLGKLADGDFPIVGLDGFTMGVEPFELVPGFEIGGGLGLGLIDVDMDPDPNVEQIEEVFYGRIFGTFSYEGLGAGMDLVLSEYGPVLAQVQVPLGIPIDGGLLGGVILASVEGGLKFGGDEFLNPERPLEILHDPAFDTDFPITPETIRDAVEPAVQDEVYTWDNGFTLALSGNLTHAFAPGIISGEVTIGANIGLDGGPPRLKLIGSGDVSVYGMPFAGAALLIDLSEPLEPQFDLAFATPQPGNPLGFLMPATGTFEISLDTTGVLPGFALGVRTFVERTVAGGLDVGQAFFDAALTELAQTLNEDHSRPLAQLLLAGQPSSTVITRDFLVQGVLNRIAVGGNGLPVDPVGAAAVSQAFMFEILDVGGDVIDDFDLSAVSSDPDYTAFADILGAGAEAVVAMLGVVRDAVLDAGAAFIDQLDPAFSLSGALQPVILGIPFGQPQHEVELIITKDGLGFGFETSFGEISRRVGDAIVPFLGGHVVNFMSLGFEDQLGMTVQLPIGGVVDGLFGGSGIPDIDPFDADWAIELRGGVRWNDFEIGQMTGLVIAAGNQGFLDAHVQKLFENPGAPIDPNRIPIQDEQHYIDLLRHGGVLFNGRLLLPELLTDPVGLLTTLNLELPENPFELPQWVAGISAHLSRVVQPANVQVFLPGFASVLDFDFDATTEADRITAHDTGQVLADSVNELFAAAYLEGTFEGELLSVEIGRALVEVHGDEIAVTGEIPLIGLGGTFLLDTSLVQTPAGPVELPRAAAEVTIDDDDIDDVLAGFGIPSIFSGLGNADSLFRAYSPAYDLDSTDPLLQFGGFEVQSQLDLLSIVQDANFTMALALNGDVTAEASVASFTPLPGITLTNGHVGFTQTGDTFAGSLDGAVTLPAWLTAATGVATTVVNGSFDSTGNVTLLVTINGVTYDLVALVTATIDQIVDFLVGLSQSFIRIADILFDHVTRNFTTIVDQLVRLGADLFEVAEAIRVGAAASFNTVVDQLVRLGADFVEIADVLFQKVTQNIGIIVDQLIRKTASFPDVAEALFQKVTQDINTIVDQLIRKTASFPDVAEALFQKVTQDINTIVDQLFGKKASFPQIAEALFAEVTQDIVVIVDQLFRKAATFTQIAEALFNEVTTDLATIIAQLLRKGADITEIADALDDGTTAAVFAILNAIDDFTGALLPALVDALEALGITTLGPMITNLLNLGYTSLADIAAALDQAATAFSDFDILNAIDDFTQATLNNLIDALEALGITTLGPMITNLLNLGYTSLADIAAALDQAATAFSDFDILNAIDDFTGALLPALVDALEALGITTLGPMITNLLNLGYTSLADIAAALDQAATAFSDFDILNAIDDFTGALLPALVDALEALGITTLGPMITNLLNLGYTSLADIAAALDQAATAFSDFDILNAIDDFTQATLNNLIDALEALGITTLGPMITNLLNLGYTSLADIAAALDQAATAFSDFDILNAIDDFTGALLPALVDALEALGITTLGPMITNLLNLGYTSLADIAAALDQAATAFSDFDILNAIDDFTQATLNNLIDALEALGVNALTAIIDAIEALGYTDLVAMAAALDLSAVGSDDSILNAIDDATQAGINDLVNAIEAMGTSALTTIVDMLQAIGYTDFRALTEALDDATTATYRDIAKAIVDATNASFSAIGDALRFAGASFATVVDALDWATTASVSQIADAIRFAGATFTQVMQALEDELSVDRFQTAAQLNRLGAGVNTIINALIAVYNASIASIIDVLVQAVGLSIVAATQAVCTLLGC